jgi:hypothetical protein
MANNEDGQPQVSEAEKVCPFSMAGAEIRFCRQDCKAYRYYKNRDGDTLWVCVFVSSLNQISLSMKDTPRGGKSR